MLKQQEWKFIGCEVYGLFRRINTEQTEKNTRCKKRGLKDS